MGSYIEKHNKNKSKPAIHQDPEVKRKGDTTIPLEYNRPTSVMQGKLQELINNSTNTSQLNATHSEGGNNVNHKQPNSIIQRKKTTSWSIETTSNESEPAGLPIQMVGGAKFGLRVTGEKSNSLVSEGIGLLIAAQKKLKRVLQEKKKAASETQKKEAAAANKISDENEKREAQLKAQTKYTKVLSDAEYQPDDLIKMAGSDFSLEGGVIKYKKVEIARVVEGTAAYERSEDPQGEGYSAVYKRHTLEGRSKKDYIKDKNDNFIRRIAHRGITPPERKQFEEGAPLTPLNLGKLSGELGYNFSQSGKPIPRGKEKGTDLETLNEKTGAKLGEVPDDPQVQSYLQVRKGVGKFFSATSTGKTITSNHDGSFTDKGSIEIDLARVPLANLVHHYKRPKLSAKDIQDATKVVRRNPSQPLIKDVERGNQSVLRNREIVLSQIPNEAVTKLNGKSVEAFKIAYEKAYHHGYNNGYTTAFGSSGLKFSNDVIYNPKKIKVTSIPSGAGAEQGQIKGYTAGKKLGKETAEPVIKEGRKFLEDYSESYEDGYRGMYNELTYEKASKEDDFDASTYYESIVVVGAPKAIDIPSKDDEEKVLESASEQGEQAARDQLAK